MNDHDLPHDELWVEMWGEDYRSDPHFQEINDEYRNSRRDIGSVRADVHSALIYRAKEKSDSSHHSGGWPKLN